MLECYGAENTISASQTPADLQQPCRNFSRKLRYRWAVWLSSSRQGPTDSKERSLIRILPKSITKCGSYWHKSFTPLITIWIPLKSFLNNSQFLSGNQRTSVDLHFPKSFKNMKISSLNFLVYFPLHQFARKSWLPLGDVRRRFIVPNVIKISQEIWNLWVWNYVSFCTYHISWMTYLGIEHFTTNQLITMDNTIRISLKTLH